MTKHYAASISATKDFLSCVLTTNVSGWHFVTCTTTSEGKNMNKIANYVKTIHNDCDRHDAASRASAQQRLRQLERQQSARPVAIGTSRRSAVAAWDRLRAAGLLPAPRILPSARPLPDAKLPEWMVGLREDELGLAWIASAEFNAASPTQWRSRAKSIARDERTGRYGGESGRTVGIVRGGATSYLAADGATVKDWIVNGRDNVDDHKTTIDQLNLLREGLGVNLVDCLASGMTQQESANVCGKSLRSIEYALQTARKRFA